MTLIAPALVGSSQCTISHKWIFLLAKFSFKAIMVDFMCQLDWAKGCLAGKILFLGVSVRVSLEEISI